MDSYQSKKLLNPSFFELKKCLLLIGPAITVTPLWKCCLQSLCYFASSARIQETKDKFAADDCTRFIYLVFCYIRIFLSTIKIKLTFIYQAMRSVTEWSRSMTSLEWLIWLISGTIITNSHGFVNISWVSIAFIACASDTPADVTVDKAAVIKSSFCISVNFIRDLWTFSPNFLPLFSLQTLWLVEQMKYSSGILVTNHYMSTFA